MGAVDDNLSGMFEVHGDPAADHRLHLSQSPVRALGVAHQHAGLEEIIHGVGPFAGCPVLSSNDLSALVSARLCHDLISPMGAIGNGLELLQLAGGPAGPELALVNDSLATAIAKLRFFRVAFGPADPQARMPIEEISQITDAMFHGRFAASWDARGELSRPVARLACLAVLCLEKSLPMGGHVRIELSGGSLALEVQDRRIAAPAALWAHATEGSPLPDLTPDVVQFALLRNALLCANHRISARFSETTASVAITATDPVVAEVRI